MTRHGSKLSTLTAEEVTERLREETDGKAIKRLVAAREYLAGRSPAQISAKFGWPEQTIYSWLDRFESDPLDDALYDESPPGRPSRLSEDEFETVAQAVSQSPELAGFTASEWSTPLLQEYLREEFGYEFSQRHVRRLVNRAGR